VSGNRENGGHHREDGERSGETSSRKTHVGSILRFARKQAACCGAATSAT
jgi:hypothetical protein